ncbi:methyltransferase domain-containing protein [Ruminiclostridium herbifermentans]|uniref:Methyltransferase domain-containing protein n=1 Tax=Ruminiclostridium herbifermentans TaxID=2488810 RepID=A0A4U7JKQ1_9FIRM|nr:methyltransferase domain-containing protein [Ruminiclostridium herbifermentans]QNU67068.1 methyltransferase domain-containing protein [Ruminiclostridium herbifermentans]
MFATGSSLEQSRSFYWKEDSLNEFLDFIDTTKVYPKVLDVGCGTGFMTEILAKHLKAENVIGVDLNEQSLGIAKKRLVDLKLDKIQYQKGNIHELEFEDNSFDLVFCHYVLVDCQKPDKVLSEMFRVAKLGATVCCIEPIYQIDMLNCYMPLLNPDELDIMAKIYKKMIVDIPRSMGIDRTIATSLPKRFKDNDVSEMKIKLHGNYSCSLDFTEETIEMMKRQSQQVISQKAMLAQSFKSHPVLKNLSETEIDSYINTQIKLSEAIINNPDFLRDGGMFTAGFNMLVKGTNKK